MVLTIKYSLDFNPIHMAPGMLTTLDSMLLDVIHKKSAQIAQTYEVRLIKIFSSCFVFQWVELLRFVKYALDFFP